MARIWGDKKWMLNFGGEANIRSADEDIPSFLMESEDLLPYKI